MAIYLLSDGAENIVTYPYSIGMLRRDNPNTSFPASPSNAVLAGWNVFQLAESTQPTIDVLTQSIVEGTPTTADGGVTWTQVWEVVELDAAAQVTKLAQLEAAAQGQSEALLDEADQFVVQALVQGKALTPEFEVYRNSVLNYQSLSGYPAAPVFPTLPAEVFDTSTDSVAVVDLTNITTNSVTFNDVDVRKTSTIQTATQVDYDPTPPLVLSPKLHIGRFPGGGDLVNYKADVNEGSDWGQLGYDMNDDVDWSISGWTGDVTAHSDYSYEIDDKFETDPTRSTTVAADITGAEWVMHDINSDRYWKFDFHTWTPWSDNMADPFVTPPGYSYTRTEYSDPATGTLDPATEVTFTVADGWEDSHKVDVLINSGDKITSIGIRRGFGEAFSNVYADPNEIYNNIDSQDFPMPWGTEVAVVSEFVEALDSGTTFYRSMDLAYGGGVDSKAVGSKMVLREIETGKVWGFDFSAWTPSSNGAGWTAEVVELNLNERAGISFADGTKLTTKPGNVKSDLNWTEDYWGGKNTAPLTFFKNEDIGNNNIDYSYNDITAHTSFGLANFGSQVTGDTGTYLRADRIYGFGEWYLSGLLATNGTWCGYSGSYNHAYSWASYDVNRRQTIERIQVANYATDYTIGITCADPTRVNGHWKTKYYIRNNHASQNVSVVGQGITIATKAGVTMPSIAPGEEWIVELEVFKGLDNTPRYIFVDAYQVV